ncbi:MAG: SRPBCC family protein [Candidatus Acidiferrales bacterium]
MKVSTPTEREIVMTRVFDAPRRLVFDAHTQCELLKRWHFGPEGWSLAVCEMDLRVGGKYRHVWRHANKKEIGTGGVYREIVPPERLVTTEKFDGYAEEAVNTMVLVESGGRTTLTLTMLFETRESRDMVLQTGMEQGVALGFDRLDEVLSSLGA